MKHSVEYGPDSFDLPLELFMELDAELARLENKFGIVLRPGVATLQYANLQAEAENLKEELRIADELLDAQVIILDKIPECQRHGKRCLPYISEWIDEQLSHEVNLYVGGMKFMKYEVQVGDIIAAITWNGMVRGVITGEVVNISGDQLNVMTLRNYPVGKSYRGTMIIEQLEDHWFVDKEKAILLVPVSEKNIPLRMEEKNEDTLPESK